MLSLRSLRHVLALAEHRNFARAADALDIGQPALSRSVSALEARLGVQLFDRGRTGVCPTAAGRVLVEQATAVVERADAAERVMGSLHEIEPGDLVVAAGPAVLDISVTRAIARLAAAHPQLTLRVVVVDWREAPHKVREGEVEVAVAELSTCRRDLGLRLEPLPRHPALFFCRRGHPILANRGEITFERMLDHAFAGTPLPPRVAMAFPTSCAAGAIDGMGNFVPRLHVEGSVGAIVDVVRQSDAIGFAVPHGGIDLDSDVLAPLMVESPWLVTGYGFLSAQDRPLSEAARLFVAAVRGVEREVTEEIDEAFEALAASWREGPRARLRHGARTG